jgi:type VI secretion system secreted protein Hcp
MRRPRLVMIGTVVSIVAAFGVAPAAQAAEDYFLAVQTGTTGPAIQGETLDATFSSKKAIELNSFDWSAENAVTIGSASGGSGAGKATLNRLTVEKRVDSASAALFQRLATGAHIPSMELFVRKSGATGLGHLKYRFTGVFVSSVSPSGDGEQMRERVTFAYGSVAQSYTQQTAAGTAGTVFAAGWNQIANIACTYGSCETKNPPLP